MLRGAGGKLESALMERGGKRTHALHFGVGMLDCVLAGVLVALCEGVDSAVAECFQRPSITGESEEFRRFLCHSFPTWSSWVPDAGNGTPTRCAAAARIQRERDR